MANWLGLLLGGLGLYKSAQTIGNALSEGDQGIGSADKMKLREHSVRNLDDKIRILRKLVDEALKHPQKSRELRDIVTRVLSQRCGKTWCVAEKDWRGEVEAIFNFVRQRVRYTKDIDGKDTFQSPLYTLSRRAGDCDDFSTLLAAMLRMAGHRVKFRVVRTKKSSNWDHIYVLVEMPPGSNRWMALDASVPERAGWEAPSSIIAAKRDFNV